jgi:hypothetical protein
VQKMAKRARLLETRWQRGQRLISGRVGDKLPMPESETAIEPRCVCSSPVVMWEGEYFCSVTGDHSDKCSGAVTSLGFTLR